MVCGEEKAPFKRSLGGAASRVMWRDSSGRALGDAWAGFVHHRPEQWVWSRFRHYASEDAGPVLVNEQRTAELLVRETGQDEDNERWQQIDPQHK